MNFVRSIRMLKPLYGNKIVRKMAYLPSLCCLAIFVNIGMDFRLRSNPVHGHNGVALTSH